MKEIETAIVQETAKFVEALASTITTAIITKLVGSAKSEQSVTIYR